MIPQIELNLLLLDRPLIQFSCCSINLDTLPFATKPSNLGLAAICWLAIPVLLSEESAAIHIEPIWDLFEVS